jgi:hypothetical protein
LEGRLEVHVAAVAVAGAGSIAFSFSGRSVTSVSVVSTMPAIEAAFWSAERVTLAGVDDALLEHVAVLALLGVVAVAGSILRTASTTTEPSWPALIGDLAERLLERAAQDVDADQLVTELRGLSSAGMACTRTVPPPATMPSSTPRGWSRARPRCGASSPSARPRWPRRP